MEYCEPEAPQLRFPIVGPVQLLIEHPFKDRGWMVTRRMPEPGWYILATIDGQVMALHETQFTEVQ
jgi:hypothetical protein